MTQTSKNTAGFTIYPVGVVKSDIKKPSLGATEHDVELKEHMSKVRQQHQWINTLISELEIFPELDGILEGIEDFSHIMVLYWPHLIPEDRRSLKKRHPMGRKEFPEKGVFSTCSPARPNPVLVSTVRLLSCDGYTLRVQGLEAVDGSPIIDIKPFVKMSHGADNPTVPDWMQKIHRELEAEYE